MKSSRFQCISRAREEWLVVDGGVGVDGRNALLPKNHSGLYIYIFIESQVKKVKNSKPENAVICHML